MAEVKKEKVPVKYYEIVDRKSSGFIMDGTEGTQYEQQLQAPSVQWISSQAMTAEIKDGVKHHVPIRYINRCDSIYPMEQEKMGFVVNRFEDKIAIESGFINVHREGSTIGLYDFLEKAFWNQDNPDRPSDIPARYKEVKLDKRAVALLDEDELLTQAKSLVYELRRNTGNKKALYKYDTDRIDAICRMVGVWDETPERKLILLLQRATHYPKEFVDTVRKSEQTVITEISHGLELGVIQFNGNVAQYTDGDKVIVAVEGDKLRADQKIEKLASWLATGEGTPSLTEMRAKVELAKERLLKD